MGREFPLHRGRELYQLWEGNFIAYYRMNAYRVDVSVGGGSMSADEIAAIMSRKLPDPQEPVYTVTLHDLLKVLAAQLGSEALLITNQELRLFHDEVKTIFAHYIDERELYQLALQQFNIIRAL